MEHSAFLADINNESPDAPTSRQENYRRNLASLQRLVLFQVGMRCRAQSLA